MGKEGRMQSDCVHWYKNDWYKNLNFLWATFNEGLNSNGKISLGLVPGVSDLLLYEPKQRGLGGLEAKFPGESHEVDHLKRQANWIIEVCDFGGFFDNLPQFQLIIQGESAWYDPERVLAYLDTVKTKSFVWDGKKFL